MAGIYIHIPFCKQKCSYCDFHFSTSLKYKETLLIALQKEIESKKGLLKDSIKTIYFGGGTPSILSKSELDVLLNSIHKNYAVSSSIELTLECNPDDLNKEKLQEFKDLGVNRLSIGIQSFFDDDLKFFNRAHNAKQAEQSILLSQEAGIENISIDLIYGTPTLTTKKWLENLTKVQQLNLPHLSAYTLTVEPKTELYDAVKKGKVTPVEDEKTIEQFQLLLQKTDEYGLIPYEISNFGKKGFYSQHNSNYWKGEEFLGFGPSAHSYIEKSRMWNISNNIKYIDALTNNTPYFSKELINEITAYNEYILTRLRTSWGVDTSFIRSSFNEEINLHFKKELNKYLNSPYLRQVDNTIILTDEGMLMTDKITSDLFLVK